MGQKFTIIESKWYRGHSSCGSALGIADSVKYVGQRCCLGQLACAIGYTSEEIRGISMPFRLPCGELFFPLLVEEQNSVYAANKCKTTTKLATQIAKVNDNIDITDDERKAQLIPLFAKMGYDLEFAP